MILFFGGKVPLCIRFQLGNSFGNTCFFGKVLECKKINKAQMVDFHKKNHKRFAKDKVEKTTVSQ